ncbi:amine N-methyltransferase activity [Pristimantis euphronides]
MKKTEKLRSKVTDFLKCDVLKRNPYDPIIVPPVDCLMTLLCLENACTDMKSYCDVLTNFKGLIKPGGHLLSLGALNANYFHIGKRRFATVAIKKEELETAFTEAGHQIERAVYVPRTNTRLEVSDYHSPYFIHARKPK